MMKLAELLAVRMNMRVFCKTMALLAVLTGSELIAQNTLANVQQSVVFAGLRTGAGAGGFHSVAVDPAGNIYLLEDRQDGVRILKVASDGGAILASALFGAKGDDGVALALDPTGSVYVAGTTSSGALNATSGAAISTATPATINSFMRNSTPISTCSSSAFSVAAGSPRRPLPHPRTQSSSPESPTRTTFP